MRGKTKADILADREAFVHGMERAWLDDPKNRVAATGAEARDAFEKRDRYRRAIAAERYPLPKVPKTREVRDCHHGAYRWRVEAGKLQWATQFMDHWKDLDAITYEKARIDCITPERAGLWQDLLLHPTELVEDEG